MPQFSGIRLIFNWKNKNDSCRWTGAEKTRRSANYDRVRVFIRRPAGTRRRGSHSVANTQLEFGKCDPSENPYPPRSTNAVYIIYLYTQGESLRRPEARSSVIKYIFNCWCVLQLGFLRYKDNNISLRSLMIKFRKNKSREKKNVK